MIAFIITYTCQLLQLMSYKIDVQNFSYKFKNTLVLQNCTFCFKQGLWCMEFYSPFQGISLVYQQKIVNIKTLFILNNAFEEKYQFQLFLLNSSFFTWNFLIPNQLGNLWPPIKIKKKFKICLEVFLDVKPCRIKCCVVRNFGICLLCSDGTGLKIK